jgi:hypothetical protein
MQKKHVQMLCSLAYIKRETCRSEYVFFKSTNYFRFCHFCVAHNTNNFILKFYMLIGYTIYYVQIYFYNFLKLINISFEILKITGSRDLFQSPVAVNTIVRRKKEDT